MFSCRLPDASECRRFLPASVAYLVPVADDQPFPPGARRAVRPTAVIDCPACGELAGRGYPACLVCAELVDQFWTLDWRPLVEVSGIPELELAELVLLEDVGKLPWTCTDVAMTLLRCQTCGAELGTGDLPCLRCRVADENRWAWDHMGYPERMTGNEHAMRVARMVLRAPHRQRETIVQGWRLTMPFLLLGELPTTSQAQRIRAHVLAERYDELAQARSLTDLAGLPSVPWRREA